MATQELFANLPLPYDPIISSITTKDVRFPTSLDQTGSDAMNAAGDYSAGYCILHTSIPNTGNSTQPPPKGHGMTFTIGRGNELITAAIPLIAEAKLLNKSLSSLVGENFSKTWRSLTSGDSQLRWVGPEKGVVHLAAAAIVNALWDLWAKVLGKPVWRLVADMTPEEIVHGCLDFRYVTDAITQDEALRILREAREGGRWEARVKDAETNEAVPAYTTSAGWLGYSIEKMRGLLRDTKNEGYKHFKLKVGAGVEKDKERLRVAREEIGEEGVLMTDANQIWDVDEAIDYMKQLKECKPWFIEEPTSPDDVLGHKRVREALKPLGIGVATGEMCQNRVMFKQLLQAGAIDVCQVDACRLGGLNEVLIVLLMAKKFSVPVVPHSGGVGLPEYTQHVSTIDYVCVSGNKSILEYVDSLHEHFLHPSRIINGHCVTPTEPGYSVEMKPESMQKYKYPGDEGLSWWRTDAAKAILEGARI
ncbi:MAG: L-galactonate dehydratase [Chrysothrix sp. TS-e1954]|nr:MAG: L-galactonate dehydratase [Chrysothrix sp. TS-e1954]